MTDEEMAVNWIRSQGWNEETLPNDEFGQMFQAYLAGLKAERPKWHKPSEKLPEECSLVLAYVFDETEPSLCEYIVSDKWECLPKRIVFCSNDQVRAWKELPALPKEIEND